MINYRILHEQKLIAICHWGKTTVEEILRFSQNLRSDPDFLQSYDTILFKTQIENELTSDDIYKFSSPRIDTSKPVGKIAVIASAPLTYGTSRMHEMMSEVESPHELAVFWETGAALKWLDREGLDIESIFEDIKRETK